MFLKVRFILYGNYSGKRIGANLAGTRSPLHSAQENPPEPLSASTVWGIYMDIHIIYSGIPWSCHGVIFFSYCVATCAKWYAPRACSWSGLRRIRCRTQNTLAEKRLHYCTARCVSPRLTPIRIANVYKLQLHTLQAALVCSGTVELNKRPKCSINPVATTTAAEGKQSRLKFIIQNAFLCVFMHKYNDVVFVCCTAFCSHYNPEGSHVGPWPKKKQSSKACGI